MHIAPIGPTKPEAGVMATRPATAPEQMPMTVGLLRCAHSAFTWMLVEWAHRSKPTVIGICSGAVAGLVAITPASGFVGPVGSMCIGVAAGAVCYWGVTGLKRLHGIDDALD